MCKVRINHIFLTVSKQHESYTTGVVSENIQNSSVPKSSNLASGDLGQRGGKRSLKVGNNV
jgi:hypothetical protein